MQLIITTTFVQHNHIQLIMRVIYIYSFIRKSISIHSMQKLLKQIKTFNIDTYTQNITWKSIRTKTIRWLFIWHEKYMHLLSAHYAVESVLDILLYIYILFLPLMLSNILSALSLLHSNNDLHTAYIKSISPTLLRTQLQIIQLICTQQY